MNGQTIPFSFVTHNEAVRHASAIADSAAAGGQLFCVEGGEVSPMNPHRFSPVAALVVLLAVLAVTAGIVVQSGNSAAKGDSVVLLYNGYSVANTHAAPQTEAFSAWCNSACFPSVMLPVSDAVNGASRGTIYVWVKNFVASGNTTCFGEFIWYALNDGDVYTSSGSNGTCGASLDPALKPATHLADATVSGGGGDGTIVPGGTGKYKNWTGTYTDRVFVEVGPGVANYYYDQLFFSITRG